jgi:hypothetical protein
MTEDGFKNITHSVFENGPLNMWGKTLTLYTSTVTIDPITGDKTITYDAGASITGIITRRNSVRNRDKEGFIELGPAYLMVLTSVSVKIEDKIKDPDTGEIFKIMSKINRKNMYYYCELIYWET